VYEERGPDQAVSDALVERARGGDQTAFDDLVRLHQELCFRVAYLVTGDAGEAEDAAQDAFIKAYLALDRFQVGAPFRPWLLRIVANEARNRVRRRGRQRGLMERAGRLLGLSTRAAGGASEGVVADPGPGPEETALRSERQAALRRALQRAPEQDRLVIEYRYFLELSEAETAAALDCPPGTVKSRLSRALARLRSSLEEDT
jgi:RNA polymerase sigma-70 factor, ECF subfamily